MGKYWIERRERRATYTGTEIPMLRCSGATRQGSRTNNQDNLRLGSLVELTEPVGPFCVAGRVPLDRTQVYCVCDGIGGSARGELAAWMALRAIRDCFEQMDIEKMALRDVVMEAAEAAQSAVLELYRNMGMPGGCTLTMVALRGSTYEFLNIGDSPAFFYDRARRQLRELSVRHDSQWLSRTNGEQPGKQERSRLLNYLGREGFMAAQMAHTCSGEIRCGDGILLCSDGTANAFPPAKLKRAMRKRMDADRMTDRASRIPGADNSTAIVLMAERQ